MRLPSRTAPGAPPGVAFLLVAAFALPLARAWLGAAVPGAGTGALPARPGPALGTHQLRRLACPARL
eukprot:4760465-Lingulodinium_polyedra.AAC.1